MKKTNKNLLITLIIVALIFPLLSFYKKSEAKEYKDVTAYSNKAEYIAACKGRYNGGNIKDVIFNGEAYKEYRYTYNYSKQTPYTEQVEYSKSYSTGRDADTVKNSLIGTTYSGGKVISGTVTSKPLNEKNTTSTSVYYHDVYGRINGFLAWPEDQSKSLGQSQIGKTINNMKVVAYELEYNGIGGTSSAPLASLKLYKVKLKLEGTTTQKVTKYFIKLTIQKIKNDTKTKTYGWTKESNAQKATGLANSDLGKVKTETRTIYNITVITDEASTDSNETTLDNSSISSSTSSNTVESTEIENPGSDQKQTETIDNGTATENAIAFAKKLYMGMLGKSEEEANKDITKDSSIVKDILEGKTDAASLITYFDNLERPYASLSLEEYAKYMYKAILEKDLTDEEVSKITEKYSTNENYQSEILAEIISSAEFKTLCEKYSIKVGTYTVKQLNANTTEAKATEFVENLYSTLMNKTPSSEELTKIVENIVGGKITASSVLKAFFESDEFKNLKVSDQEYVEMLAKVCWNKELTIEQNGMYTKKLLEGTTRNELLKEFMNSDFAIVCEGYGLTKGIYEPGELRTTSDLALDFVKNVHYAILGSDTQVVQAAVNNLANGHYSASDLIQIYVESSNFANKMTTENMSNSDYIKSLFKACLQRDAKSEEESKQYEEKIDNSYKSSVLAEFFKLDEYKHLCNSYYLLPGQYTDNRENNESEPTVENYQNTGAKITTKQRTLSNGKTVKSIIKVEFDTSTGLLGDVDGDNNIKIDDASLVLSYVAIQELYFEKPTEEVLKVADVDNDKMITVEDAQYILQYYAMKAASLNPTWEDAIKASNEYEANGGAVAEDSTTDETNITNTIDPENTTDTTN